MKYEARELLARRIRALRRERKWSQEKLAEESGLHRTYIGGIERAVRSCGLDTLDRIAHAFNISLAELLDFHALAQTSANAQSSSADSKEAKEC